MSKFTAEAVRTNADVSSILATTGPLARVTPIRARFTISIRAAECLDFLITTLPLVFDIDPTYLKKRPDTFRFAIRWLAELARSVGIDDRVDRRASKFFLHRLVQEGKTDDWLDLTPEAHYRTPGQDDQVNITYETADDDLVSLRKLKAIYGLKGIRSNNHLAEAVIYSMSACVMAYAAGFVIQGFSRCLVLNGFGDVCVDVEPKLISALNPPQQPEPALATVIRIR